MELTKHIVVRQPVDTLWQILAVDYARVGEWTTAVAWSRPSDTAAAIDGAPVTGRICSAPGIGQLTEAITRFDERNRVFSYRAEASGILSLANGITNTWSLRARDEQTTEVSTRVVGRLPGAAALLTPLMRLWIQRITGRALAELKYYAETGSIHPRKLRALQKADRRPAAT